MPRPGSKREEQERIQTRHLKNLTQLKNSATGYNILKSCEYLIQVGY